MTDRPKYKLMQVTISEDRSVQSKVAACLGNEHVWFDAQVEHVPGPNLLTGTMETSPHWVELYADALFYLFIC